MSRLRRCALLLLLLPTFPAAAGDPSPLTLEGAIAIALRQNHEIGKADAYGDYVVGRYREERAAALPQLSLGAFARRERDESQPADSASRRLASEEIDLTLSQPLFTFGKIGAAIRAAEIGLGTAEERRRFARQLVIRDVSIAYYDGLFALRRQQLALENLAQKERHRDEARTKFAAGVATDYDVLAATVAVDNARPELIRGDTAVQLANQRLALLLGEPLPFVLAGTLEAPVAAAPDAAAALATALARRPELREQQQRVGIYRELVTIAAAGNKPRLDFRGGGDWRRWDAQIGRGDGPGWNAGLYLSMPLFDGWRTFGQVQGAESELRTRRLEEAQLRDRIVLEVREAVRGREEAAAIVAALQGTVAQAQRLLQMAEQGYRYGVKTRLDIDDAQLGLLLAESNLARALRDQLAAAVQLQWAMGVLGE